MIDVDSLVTGATIVWLILAKLAIAAASLSLAVLK